MKKKRAVKEQAEIEKKVIMIIAEKLAISEEKITPQASFVDDLKADSLDQVELIIAYEDAFDFEIPDEDAEKIKSVKDAIEYIKAHA